MGAEIFLLIIMFELLREAGTRLPKAVGSAITIVGALIIGDAAVNAGIVSAPAVIIVALTAVTSFIVPALSEFTLVYRLFLLLLGGTMGLIGIGSGLVIMMIQLISTTSFGIPILSNFSKEEMKDSFLRFPLGSLQYRPSTVVKDNMKRTLKK
jgi:spore germination protein KA